MHFLKSTWWSTWATLFIMVIIATTAFGNVNLPAEEYLIATEISVLVAAEDTLTVSAVNLNPGIATGTERAAIEDETAVADEVVFDANTGLSNMLNLRTVTAIAYAESTAKRSDASGITVDQYAFKINATSAGEATVEGRGADTDSVVDNANRADQVIDRIGVLRATAGFDDSGGITFTVTSIRNTADVTGLSNTGAGGITRVDNTVDTNAVAPTTSRASVLPGTAGDITVAYAVFTIITRDGADGILSTARADASADTTLVKSNADSTLTAIDEATKGAELVDRMINVVAEPADLAIATMTVGTFEDNVLTDNVLTADDAQTLHLATLLMCPTIAVERNTQATLNVPATLDRVQAGAKMATTS